MDSDDVADRAVRVAIVIWRLTRFGGVQRVARDLIAGLDPDRFELHIVSIRPSIDVDEIDLAVEPGRFHTLDHAFESGLFGKLTLPFRFARVVRQLDPDTVLVMGGIAWVTLFARVGLSRHAASERTRRWLLQINDPQEANRQGRMTDLLEMLCIRFGVFESVAISQPVALSITAASGRSADQVLTVDLGVDCSGERRGRDVARAALHLDDATFVMLYVARLVPSKRPDDFVEMAARVCSEVPNSRAFLVGGGPDVTRLQELARARCASGRVEVVGAVEDIGQFYAAADVFCSTSEYEGFGLAIAEAMLNEMPVVAVSVGGVTDLVKQDVTGVLVDADDRDGFVDAVVALAASPERTRQLGVNARQHVMTNHSLERQNASYAAIFGGEE